MSEKISLDLIKKLREQTLVGMADCKKALEESNGDFAQAVEVLRKKGMSVAAKRSSNATENGLVYGKVSQDFHKATIVQVGCETDFSARTDSMKDFACTIVDEIVDNGHTSMAVSELSEVVVKKTSLTVSGMLTDLIAKIAENIVVSKVVVKNTGENSLVNVYQHPDLTLATMVEFKTSVAVTDHSKRAELAELAKSICMHIAFANPSVVRPEDLDPAVVEKEKEIALATMDLAGKPEQVVNKIIEGKVSKYFKEVCLNEQPYIKDDSMSIKAVLADFSKKAGYEVSIVDFCRLGIKR